MPYSQEQYLDIEQRAFLQPVADHGYYWDEKARPTRKGPKPPFLVEADGGGYVLKQLLKEEPGLFLKFAEVEETQESILGFANQYGLLLPPCKEKELDKPGPITYAEPLALWKEEIRDMRWTVQVWEWLSEEDTNSLSWVIYWPGRSSACSILADKDVLAQFASAKKLSEFRSEFVKRKETLPPFACCVELIASASYRHELFSRMKYGDLLLPARFLVQGRINRKLWDRVTRPRLLVNEENKLEPYLMPESLLAAMWLQFFQAAIGERHYKRCLHCGKWQDTTNKYKNWNAHEACDKNARQAKYRAWKSFVGGKALNPAGLTKKQYKKLRAEFEPLWKERRSK